MIQINAAGDEVVLYPTKTIPLQWQVSLYQLVPFLNNSSLVRENQAFKIHLMRSCYQSSRLIIE